MSTSSNSTKQSTATSGGRFGMFGGVFVPNVLTILGIILFLRIGWVVGQVGLWGALAIVILANLISFLTGLSLSSIATSMKVKAGGNYYLISRTLGLEIGGAIGIPLFLSQAISIAFYIIGFTEALFAINPDAFGTGMVETILLTVQSPGKTTVSIIVALLFGLISFIGADFALKIQFFILAILVGALISFFGGGWDSIQEPLTAANLTEGNTFWIVFAVFFPAVTGIEVGVSMSGDLKNPSRDIPLGTLLSIIVTAIVYILAVIWFALHPDLELLLDEENAILSMQAISLFPILILFGVWASTLSSALGSILAAPRTLQAIALDRVVPKFFAGQMGSKTEPRVAVLLSTAIAVGVILLGDLNLVAPIIAMFFLNTYGMVNLVAGLEKLVGNPSFRPRFKIHWSLSLLGAIGCYAAMFLINLPATILALVITYGIYFVLRRRQLTRTWGDMRSGLMFSMARSILLQLEGMDLSARNWRPNLIVFTGQPHNREALVELAKWLTLGQGIVTFFQLIIGDIDKMVDGHFRDIAKKNIKKYIADHDLEAFAEAEVVSSFEEGALTVSQAHGIGGLEPNCIAMGWSRTLPGLTKQIQIMRRLHEMGKSTLIMRTHPEDRFGKKQKIDIWSRSAEGNADLMLLLTHIMLQHRDWRKAEVRLIRVVAQEEGKSKIEEHMTEMIDQARVKATPLVLTPEYAGEPIKSIMQRTSKDTDLTFLGMQAPAISDIGNYAAELEKLVADLGAVLLVHNGRPAETVLAEE